VRSSLQVTFVVAVNNTGILKCNLLASPCLQGAHGHQLICQERFASAAQAYNDALDRAVNDIVVFVHQDVFLPEGWLLRLETAINTLAKDDPEWGVVGCWGVTERGEGFGYVHTPGQGVIGRAFERPHAVQTLDEIVLTIRKSSGLRFDEQVPHFHFYGAGICMQAAMRGMKSYAISAFCIHNSEQYFTYPKEFYQCYRAVKRLYSSRLPIHTACITVTRYDTVLYWLRLRRRYWKLITPPRDRGHRAADPRLILDQLQATQQV